MSKRKLLTALALCASSATWAPAQPATAADPAIEDRLNKLESSMERMLQILEKTQSASAAPSAASTSADLAAANTSGTSQVPASPTVKTEPGAILEVWSLPSGFQGDKPPGRSIGAFVDKGSYFGLANFVAQQEFESLKNNHVALKWSGYFKAEDAGTYVFSVEMGKKDGPLWDGPNSSHHATWFASLTLNGQIILRETQQVSWTGPLVHSATCEAELQPGLYELSLLTLVHSANAAAGTWNNELASITVKVRGPSDMLPVPLTAENLFHKVE